MRPMLLVPWPEFLNEVCDRKAPKHSSNTSAFILCTAIGHRLERHALAGPVKVVDSLAATGLTPFRKETTIGPKGTRCKSGVSQVFTEHESESFALESRGSHKLSRRCQYRASNREFVDLFQFIHKHTEITNGQLHTRFLVFFLQKFRQHPFGNNLSLAWDIK